MTYKTDSTAREIKTHLLSMVTVTAALWYALEAGGVCVCGGGVEWGGGGVEWGWS